MAEDERRVANRLANEEKKNDDDAGRTSTKGIKTKEKLGEKDPAAPVCSPRFICQNCQVYLALAVALTRGLWCP